MSHQNTIKHVVYTNKAKCRDCNRCVRVCPVNAIKIENGQAQVIPELCIDCGTCVVECPQHAKTYNHDLEKVLDFLKDGKRVAATIAPSFAAAYKEWERSRIPSALRTAGFSFVAETAVGAYQVAHHTKNHIEQHTEQTHICTSCPAVVSYVEKYQPDQVKNLVPIISPMQAHARIMKQEDPELKVVFIGPCIAKVQEARRPEVAADVDAAITFENLLELFKQKHIRLEACEASDFDDIPGMDAKVFPLEGGILKTAGFGTGFMDGKVLSVSGANEIVDVFKHTATSDDPLLIEPLFCKYGCINGPAIPNKANNFFSRTQIINYNKESDKRIKPELIDGLKMHTRFHADEPSMRSDFSEEEILNVLKNTGKDDPENQLNCGACGYDTCRLKAIAVLQGIAEEAMCIPYMRRLAEHKTNLLLQNDPNGILILDDKMTITSMNPAFKKMFVCSDQLIGKPVSYLLDPAPFEKLLNNQDMVVKDQVRYPNYHLNCHQVCYYLKENNSLVGVFVDITDLQDNETKLKNIKTETVIQANELLEHQINMAQDFAKFLGESSAKGELLLQKLINAID